MLLTTTLCLAAAAAIINVWLSLRIGRIRASTKIFHGDGGNELLGRRMRAHANFVENVPLTLILFALVELTRHGGEWIYIVGGAFILARVAHMMGMDSEKPNLLRAIGSLVTMLTQLGLAVVAVLIALGRF